MAVGASYPAIIVDVNGDATAGTTITFTDDTDQPSGPASSSPFKPAAGEGVTVAELADGSPALQVDDTVPGVVIPTGLDVGSGPTDLLGFYGNNGVAQPVVPQTTPNAQDIIDALVLLGLVSQSD